MALTEAIAHLNKGLDLVAALPSSAERDGKELDLRTLLGTAWIALKGWQVPEVWDSLHPALGLANSLRRSDALLPILWGLRANVTTTGRVAKSLRWVTQILDAAEAYHDPNLLIVGHTAAVISYFYLGELIKAREHADQVLALYTEERHGHLVGVLNHDLKTLSLAVYGAFDLDARLSGASREDQRRQGCPCAPARASFRPGLGADSRRIVFDHLGEPEEQLKRVEEAERVGRENSLPFMTEVLAPINSGIALIRKGQFTEGIASLKAGLAIWENEAEDSALPTTNRFSPREWRNSAISMVRSI